MTLKDRIKEFRAEFGITATAFCQRAGISSTTYYSLMAGSVLSDVTMERVSSYLAKYEF